MKLGYGMNKFLIKFSLSLLITIITAHISFAQDDNRDFESWTSMSIDFKLKRKWTFELEEQLRLQNNSSKTDQYFTQFQAGYKIFDDFELGGGLRYIKNKDNVGKIQGYENHLRFHFDTAYKHKISQFSFKHRLRYQNKNELNIPASEENFANQHIRIKTAITYNIINWRFDPKVSAEIFNQIDNNEENGFDKFRLSIGTEYNIKKFGKIGLLYRMEKELNVDNPKSTDILKLNYTYTFKKQAEEVITSKKIQNYR